MTRERGFGILNLRGRLPESISKIRQKGTRLVSRWFKSGLAADSKAGKIYLYNNFNSFGSISTRVSPMSSTTKTMERITRLKVQPFVEDIKFSPTTSLRLWVPWISMYGNFYADSKVEKSSPFSQGSSALLHVDWSRFWFISLIPKRMNSFSTTIRARWLPSKRDRRVPDSQDHQVKGVFQVSTVRMSNTVCRIPYPNSYCRLRWSMH